MNTRTARVAAAADQSQAAGRTTTYVRALLLACRRLSKKTASYVLLRWPADDDGGGDGKKKQKNTAGGGRRRLNLTMSSLPGGFLSVRVLRGMNLVSCDGGKGSDPYVVLSLDGQKLKTSVMKKTVNPVWNEDLTLAVMDASAPIKLEVFDKDKFSKDDKMGEAEFDIEALVQMVQMDLEDIRSGTVVRTVRPGGRDSCLADDSHVIWDNGQVVQDVLLRLRDVSTGVIHLQLKWVTIPG